MVVYKKFFDKLTNTWIELPVQTDPSLVEVVVHSEEQKKAMGAYKGMKGKSFSEMTPEEQKLFTNIVEKDNTEDSSKN